MVVKKWTAKTPFLFTIVLFAVAGFIVSCGTSVSKPEVKPDPSDPFGVKVVALKDKVAALEEQFAALDSLGIPNEVAAIIKGFTAVKTGTAALEADFAALDTEVAAVNTASKELYGALKNEYSYLKGEIDYAEATAYLMLDQEVRSLQEQVSLLDNALTALDAFILPDQIVELIDAFLAIKVVDEDSALWISDLSAVISLLGDYAKQRTAPTSIDQFEAVKGHYSLLNAEIANIESIGYILASQELDPIDTWLAGLNVKYSTLRSPSSVEEAVAYVKGLIEVSSGVGDIIAISNEIDGIVAALGDYAKQGEALALVKRFETIKARANSLHDRVVQSETEGYALLASELNALDREIIKIYSQLDEFNLSALPIDVIGLITDFAALQSSVASLDPWYADIETILAAAGPYTTKDIGPELVQHFTAAEADRAALHETLSDIEAIGIAVLNEEFSYLAGEIVKLESEALEVANRFGVITDRDVGGLVHALQALAVADGDVFELGDEIAYVNTVFDSIEKVQLTSSYLPSAKARFSTIKINYTDLKNTDETVVESLLDFADSTIGLGYLVFDSVISDLEDNITSLQIEFESLHKDIAAWIQQENINMNDFGLLLLRYDALVSEVLIKNAPESFGTRLTLLTADFDEVYDLITNRKPVEFGVDLDPQQKAGLNALKTRVDNLVDQAAILNSSTLKELSLAFVRVEEYEYDYLEEQIGIFNAKAKVSAADIEGLKSEFERLDTFAAQPLFATLVQNYSHSERYNPIRQKFVTLETKAGAL